MISLISMKYGRFMMRSAFNFLCIIAIRLREYKEMSHLWKVKLFDSKDLAKFVESRDANNDNNGNGSLQVQLKVSAYLNVGQEMLVVQQEGEGDASTAMNVFGGEKRLLDKVKSLMGDKKTCDVTLSVVSEDGTVIRRFPCHSFILLGNSAKFEQSIF